MALGTSISIDLPDLPALAYVDYVPVPSVRDEALELELDDADDEPDGPGYIFRAYVEENLLSEDPEHLPDFDDLQFEEVGSGAFGGSLRDAQQALLASLGDALGEDAASTFQHRLNGSAADFERALSS